MTPVKFEVQWGDLRLDVVEVADDLGRDVIVFEPTRGTGGFTQDRGPVLRRSSARVVWIFRTDGDNPDARRAAFLAAVNAGETRLYRHPLDGDFPARVGRITEQSTGSNTVSTVEFIEDRDAGFQILEAAPGTGPRASADTVQVAADAANAALAALELESSAPDESAALAASWRERAQETGGAVDARRVVLELEAQRAAIDSEIRALELDRLGRYQALLAMYALQAELGRAAEAATSDSPGTFEFTVVATSSLVAIAATLYGASAALAQARRIRALNRVDTPLAVRAGTVLTAPLRQA